MTKNKQQRERDPQPAVGPSHPPPQRISARRHQPNKHGEKPRTLWQEGKNLQETRRDSQESKGLEGGDQTTVPDRQKKERWEQTAEAESGNTPATDDVIWTPGKDSGTDKQKEDALLVLVRRDWNQTGEQDDQGHRTETTNRTDRCPQDGPEPRQGSQNRSS